MKRLSGILLILALLLTLFSGCICASAEAPAADAAEPQKAELTHEDIWAGLEELGLVETQNSLAYTYVTMPAEFFDGMTQASLDSMAGEMYISAKLNDDGSVTYKVTKDQHKFMLDTITEMIDGAVEQMLASDDYAYTKIEHNADYTCFDVSLSTEELGMMEGFMTMAFYMYGGLYGRFTGHPAEVITINYYGPSGNMITTADSSEAG